MAVTTKDNYKPFAKIEKKRKGGAVKSVKDMNENELSDYIKNKYIHHIVDSKFLFEINGSDGSIEYDYKKEDARQRIINHYKELADFTEDSLENNTIYKMNGWELERVLIDPETGEEVESTELKLIKSDNTANFSYLGEVDMDWRVYEDEDYGKFFYVIHPHLGGDPRGNYGKALILEGDNEEDLYYRFFDNFLSGQASLSFKFDDGSEVSFISQQDSDIFNFEFSEITNNSKESLSSEFINDFESLSDEPYKQDDFLDNTYDYWEHSNNIDKKNNGGSVETYTDEDAPQVEVSVVGYDDKKWFDLSDNFDGGDVINDIENWIEELNEKDNGARDDYKFTSWDGFGKEFYDSKMSESDFDSVIEGYEAFENSDFPLSVIKEYMNDTGNSDYADAIKLMEEKYKGAYSDIREMTEQMVDEGIFKPSVNDLYVTDTDKRLLANDDADMYVDNLDFESRLEYADMIEEYEAIKTSLEDEISVLEDRKSTLEENLDNSEGDEYDVIAETIADIEEEIEEKQEEIDELPNKMEDEVKEKVIDKRINEITDKIENNLEDFLEEYGYTNPKDANFVNIDYDSLSNDISSDYDIIRDNGKDYIFSSYKNGGTVTNTDKKSNYPFYIMEMTTKKIVSGHNNKSDADKNRKELLTNNPKLRFSVYSKDNITKKYKLDTKNNNDWLDLSNLKDASKVALNKSKKNSIDSEYSIEAKKLLKELEDIKINLKSDDDILRSEAKKDLKTLRKELSKLKAKHYKSTGSYSIGGIINKSKEKTKKTGSWVKKQWNEADFGDGKGKAKFNNGGDVDDVFKIITYKLTLSNDTDTYDYNSSFDEHNLESALEEFNSSEWSDFTDELPYTGIIELLEKTDTYKFIHNLDEDESIEEYPIDEFYDDEYYYVLIDEADYEIIEQKDIEGEKEHSEKEDNSYSEFFNDYIIDFKKYFKDYIHYFENAGYLGGSKYFILLVNKDGDLVSNKNGNLYDVDSEYKEIDVFNENSTEIKKQTRIQRHPILKDKDLGVIQVRISDHKHKYSCATCNAFLDIIIEKDYSDSEVSYDYLDYNNLEEEYYMAYDDSDSFLHYSDIKEWMESIDFNELKENEFKKGGDVWINDVVKGMKKKGTIGAFTKQAKQHNMTPIEFAKEVLKNPNNYIKRTIERAQFVKNTNPDKF